MVGYRPEFTRFIAPPAGVPLDLAARGAWKGARSHKDDIMQAESEFPIQSAYYCCDKRFYIGVAYDCPIHFKDQYHSFRIAAIDAESRRRTAAQRLMARAGRHFDVEWVDVRTANDNDILEPAGNEQTLPSDEAQISRS
jgi:hypothetical protein